MGAGEYDAIIVGAGIGGLTLAFKLHRGGLNVLVLEKNSRVGGWANTSSVDGYVLENGPNSTFATEQVLKLCHEVDLEDQICFAAPAAKQRFVLLRRTAGHSSLIKVPDNLKTAMRTPLLTWNEKLRALAEPFMPTSGVDDESVMSFASRRFGSGIANKVLAPALSGIWAADINTLSARSALSRLVELEREFGSILRGMLKTKAEKRRRRGPTISFYNGMQQLALHLAAALPEGSLLCEAAVQRVRYDQSGVRVFARTAAGNVQQFNGKKLILTADSVSTARLIEDAAPALAERIEAIPHAPMGVMHLAWNADALEKPPVGFGFLATPAKGKPLLGALFNSNCFPARAPEGKLLITCFLGGSVNKDLCDPSNQNVARLVLSEISGVLGARVPPKVVSSLMHKRAIPNYPIGHFELQQKVKSFNESHNRVWILSNWLEGLGVADRIEKAGELASKLLEDARVEDRAMEISSAQN